ncbi:MAG: hypothetical protein KBC73_09025 [Burkholderiaceae bacterium]|nr:hypothetical protein [Burkholderiaceae bacterium]
MTGFTRSPRLVKGGLVMLDASSGALLRVIALQYNPDALTRSLQLQGAGEGGDRLEALRLKGPPVETLRIEAELDAADQLEFPQQNATTVEVGVAAQLAAIEQALYPSLDQLLANDALAARGSIEILPAAAPLLLFVWGSARVVPVRLTEFSITEEAFDPLLNPIRAKVSLGLRVLSINDLPFASRGGSLYLAHQRQVEALAQRAGSAALAALGLQGLP